MPLESAVTLLRNARDERYAVGYFESWSLDSLQGVIDAAELTRSPVVIGFNGDFLDPDRRAAERLSVYGAMGKAVADSATVPCSLIFNECPADAWTRRAIESGFNLVMPADPEAPPAELRRRVAAVVREAHARGVAVEGEIGELPHGDRGTGRPTEPVEAEAFVGETRVDMLAISVGNVHISLDGRGHQLDLTRLESIARRVEVPLVLHGGTGIASEALRSAIALGVAKVNFGTYIKQRYLSAVRAALLADETDPHKLLGIGGPEDVLVAGRLAVRDAVMERIDELGCRGKADTRRGPR